MDQAASYRKEHKTLHKTVHFHSTLLAPINSYFPDILDKRRTNISSVKGISFA